MSPQDFDILELLEKYNHGNLFKEFTSSDIYKKYMSNPRLNVIEEYDLFKLPLEHRNRILNYNQNEKDIAQEYFNFQVYFHLKNLNAPKSLCNSNKNTSSVDGYVYWITLSPKNGVSEKQLRDYVLYLTNYNPRIFGCFEYGAETKRFHAHFVIHQDKKFDSSKTPYISYHKKLGEFISKKTYDRINNWEHGLVKLRYMCKESKNNDSFFGDFLYFNSIIKEKLDCEILNLERQKELNFIKQINLISI